MCFQNDLPFALDVIQLPNLDRFELFPLFSIAVLASRIPLPAANEKTCAPNCNGLLNKILCLQCFLCDFFPELVPFTIQCLVDSKDSTFPTYFVFGTLSGAPSLATVSYTRDRHVFFFLVRHGRFHLHFQLFLAFLILLTFFVFRINKINSSSFARSRALAFLSPILVFLFSKRLCCYCGPYFWPHMIWSCRRFELLSVSTQTTYPLGGSSLEPSIFLKPVHESDKLQFASTFQSLSVRFLFA